jgi:hypothetical protein
LEDNVFDRTRIEQEWSPGTLLVRINLNTSIWKIALRFFKKLNIEWSDDSKSTILDMHPNNGYQDVQDGCTHMLSIALSQQVRKRKK